MHAGIFL